MKRLLLVPVVLAIASLTACYEEKQADVIAVPVAVPAADPVIVVGPAGEKGDTGEQGEQGNTGNTGEQGDQGNQGNDGEQGVEGEQGVDGSDR